MVSLLFDNGQHQIEVMVKSLALYTEIARGEVFAAWHPIDATGLFGIAMNFNQQNQSGFESRLNQDVGGYDDLLKIVNK